MEISCDNDIMANCSCFTLAVPYTVWNSSSGSLSSLSPGLSPSPSPSCSPNSPMSLRMGRPATSGNNTHLLIMLENASLTKYIHVWKSGYKVVIKILWQTAAVEFLSILAVPYTVLSPLWHGIGVRGMQAAWQWLWPHNTFSGLSS